MSHRIDGISFTIFFFSLLPYVNVMSLDGYWHDVAHTITTNDDDINNNNNVVLYKTSLWRFTARFSQLEPVFIAELIEKKQTWFITWSINCVVQTERW